MINAVIILVFILGLVTTESLRYVFGFPSFFKQQHKPWIGFNLDGTLADKSEFNIWDVRAIGSPVPSMISKLKEHLDNGDEVKILTARVSTNGSIRSIYNVIVGRKAVQEWCQTHIGQKLDIVSVKDFHMRLLYDDRAKQVKRNTGIIVE